MKLCEIPDIRYLWTDDKQFHEQYATGNLVKFTPYSTLDPITQDFSIYVNDVDVSAVNIKQFNKQSAEKRLEAIDEEGELRWEFQNKYYEICRENCGDLIESVQVYDTFIHPKTKKLSHTYRFIFKPVDSSMKDPGKFSELTIEMMTKCRAEVNSKLNITER